MRDWAVKYFPACMRNQLVLPLLSIGQMIEFLDEEIKKPWTWIDKIFYSDYEHEVLMMSDKKELCDALFEAVKEILNE